MNNRNLKKIYLVIFLVLIVSLSCGPPRFRPNGVDIDDDELGDLKTNVAGVFEVPALDALPDMMKSDNECDPPPYWTTDRKETIEFIDNQMIISDQQGTRVYKYQGFGNQHFCRELADGKIECISNPNKYSYTLSLYESKSNLEQCLSTNIGINQTSQPQITGDQAEDTTADDEDDNSDQENDIAEEPKPEDPPDVCMAYPEDYTWEFFNTTKEEGSKGTLCQSTFSFKNTSNTVLILYAYKETSAGSSGDQYSGYGAGARMLSPGDVFEDRVNHTSYKDGEQTYRRYTKILVLYNNTDCLWMDPRTADEAQIADSFVILLDPCNP